MSLSTNFFFLTICLGLLAPKIGMTQPSLKYSDYPDTLILETHLERGMGLFPAGAGEASFKDTSELKKWEHFPDSGFVYPDFLDSLKVGILSVYFTPPEFYNPINKQVYQPAYQEKYDRTVLLVKGIMNGEEVFIVDQNHNQDLTDDPIRHFDNLEWRNSKDLIHCKYEALVNGKYIQKHGYLNIGNYHGATLKFVSQFAETEFSINGTLFKLGVMDENYGSLCFLLPKLALLGTGDIKKDTLTKREIASLDEFVFLGDHPYRFDRFYNGSGTLVLVREKNYENQVGIQMGLLAPDFQIKTLKGEIITKAKLSNLPLMIVNLTGCNGPGTFTQFDDFYDKFKDSFHIVSLEPRINKNLPGILVDTEVEENNDFYKKYRDAYSSYDVFQIGLDGRIENVFEIHDWESSMLR